MGFWERTWKERNDELLRRFGPTEPPGIVHSYSWSDVRLPGACAMAFPPTAAQLQSGGPWHERNHWLYVTLGLTQPLDEEQVRLERAAGKQYSAHGFELGILTARQSAWVTSALSLLLTHITEGVEVKWGDRFAFGFQPTVSGELEPFTGQADELGIAAFGSVRAVLFWPYLLPDATFVTSTGKAMIMIATGITGDEWEFARATTTAQLLLLLCQAGIGQRTDLTRSSVLVEPRWLAERQRIEALGGEAADAELEAGIGRWNA